MFQVKESRIEGKMLDKIDRSLCCLRKLDVGGQTLGFFPVFSWLVTMFVLIVSNYI